MQNKKLGCHKKSHDALHYLEMSRTHKRL